MATIHLHETTTSSPEQFVAALTDFGPGRSEIFGRSADGYLAKTVKAIEARNGGASAAGGQS